MSVDDISIQLDRPNGVYYGGEVVRGTVALTTSGGGIKCRGFHIRLTGKADIHWHTGSGDSRTDYHGSTEFQSQRQTLVGKFYRTALLDNAGSDAIFGKTHGDGVIYIPCAAAEEHNLSLIVRVMDYDWGKRDDLLGELLLDVASLVRARDIRSYPLTRFGKPEKGEVSLSAKFVPTETLFPLSSQNVGMTNNNDNASSFAIEPLCLVLTVHQATGLRKADWIGKNDVYVQTYRCNANEVDATKKLPQPELKTVLPKGRTVFPFAFALHTNAPGSAELRVSDHAYIRYDIYANVDFARWRDPSRRSTIAVIPNRPVPSLQLLAPTLTQTNDQPIFNKFCGCNCSQVDGFVSVQLQTDRRSYAPGELIDFTGSSVVSNVKEELSLKIRLVQYIEMCTAVGSQTSRTIKHLLFQGSCPPNSTVDVGSLVIGVKIPSVFPSFYGGVDEPPTRIRYSCLKWTYALELKIGGEGKSSISACAPVLVAAAAPFPQAVEKAKSMIVSPDSFQTPFSVLDAAVNGLSPCDTTPYITGVEDGGSLAPAHTYGTGINTYTVEDAGAIGTNPLFQPYVNTFKPYAPMLDTTVEQPLNVTPPDSQPVAPVAEPEAGIADLLKSMDESLDKRQAVGVWVRDHPLQASQLTPQHVKQVLLAVPFSLDQPTVAAELAAGLEKTLTCEHVAVAVQVCKYQQVDVAKAMVPLVNDPQNKEFVLKEIGYSFERQAVSDLFCGL